MKTKLKQRRKMHILAVEWCGVKNENKEENHYEESDNGLENQEAKQPIYGQVRLGKRNENLNKVQPNKNKNEDT